jgi:hypothetical protein
MATTSDGLRYFAVKKHAVLTLTHGRDGQGHPLPSPRPVGDYFCVAHKRQGGTDTRFVVVQSTS